LRNKVKININVYDDPDIITNVIYDEIKSNYRVRLDISFIFKSTGILA